VAKGTFSGYGSGWNHWERFCAATGRCVSTLVREEVDARSFSLADFAAYCTALPSRRGGGALRAATIAGYCNAVGKVYQIQMGQDLVKPLDLHRRVLCGIRREELSAGIVTRRKLPLTKALLIKADPYFTSLGHMGSFLRLVFHFGSEFLLRVSELIPTEADHYPRRRDVSVRRATPGSDLLTLLVRSSKSSWEPCDRPLRVGVPNPPFSVAALLRTILQQTVGLALDGPLFPFWSYKELLLHVNQIGIFLGLPAGSFGTHSLRRGGAYDLLDQGFPPQQVQVMGRWKSNIWVAVYAELRFSDVDKSSRPGVGGGGDALLRCLFSLTGVGIGGAQV
jgi:hypothetical protein